MNQHWLKLDKVGGAATTTMSRSGSEGLEEPLLESVGNSKPEIVTFDDTRARSSEYILSSPDSSSPSIQAQSDKVKKKKLVWAEFQEVDKVSNRTARSPPSLFSPSDEISGRLRPQSYILYEGRKGGEEEGYIHVKRDDDRSRSSFAGNSLVSEGDINEDQFSYRPDFIKVELPSSNPDGSSMTIAQELQICKKTVLKPFLVFLKIIGWRSVYTTRQDINSSLWVKVFNVLYPALLFSLLLLSCATQVITCFFRDQPLETSIARNGVILIDCRQDLFSRLIFPDLILLGAYLWGLYIFRFGAPEHLVTLVETVFLSSQNIRKGQAKMVNFMRFLLVGGCVWLFFDLCVSILRVLSLRLLDEHSFLYFLTDSETQSNLSNISHHTTGEEARRFLFVTFDFFGFIFFDLLYIAVIVTYVSQCQLIRVYIGTIIDKVCTKLQGYTLEQAMTEINQTYKFLQVVNGKLSALTSICLLVFIEAAISSLYAVFQLLTRGEVLGSRGILGVVVGVCNVFLWSFITVIPIIQAGRLTSRCQQLRRLGLSIGHRPFAYHNTPQLILDSFVQYTNATRFRAKLAGIPVYPSFVIGGFFALVLGGSFLITFVPTFRLIPWL